MSHEAMYGHVRVGSTIGARWVQVIERVRGWFGRRAPEPQVEGRLEIARETRSISVEALIEGRRWDAHM